jgi:hypothetical protein
MHRLQSVTLIALCLAAASVLPAAMVARAEILNSGNSTAISGYVGDPGESFTITLYDGGVITEVHWSEWYDKPCLIGIRGRDPEGGNATWDERNLCGLERDEPQNAKSVGFFSNSRYFVRGLSVCSNDRLNHRMKGIALLAAKLPPDSSEIIPIAYPDTDPQDGTARHVNCKDWAEWVYCPSTQVAYGLDVHVKDGAIVGLALRCVGRGVD